jgi:hypothetical protein
MAWLLQESKEIYVVFKKYKCQFWKIGHNQKYCLLIVYQQGIPLLKFYIKYIEHVASNPCLPKIQFVMPNTT